MIYHVLPGDAVAGEFAKTGIEGEVIVCRECLVVGPIEADAPDQFWDERARFILAEYGEDEIEFHERVADELERLSDIDPDDQVNLWFEYEVFCSVNLWFCLSMLGGSGATICRVEPSVISEGDRWKGFGRLAADDLKICFEARKMLTADDLKLGSDLWAAYRSADRERLRDLGRSGTSAFPYLDEVCVAASEKETRPAAILNEIRSEGMSGFDKIFAEFSRRAGVYGFGDLQVERLLDHISS